MKTRAVLIVLLLGTFWGVSEAVLGEVLHAHDVPYTSVILSAIAFAALALARVCTPRVGVATLLAVIAIGYKALGMFVASRSLGQPVFTCHLTAILFLGVAFDAMRLVWRDRYDPLFAASAMYLGRAMFAGAMTWVIRYPSWVHAGLPKVLDHIFVTGTIAAAAAAIVVPLCALAARTLTTGRPWPMLVKHPRLATGMLSAALVGLWILGLGFHQFMPSGA
jgi:hypothetical protein